MTCTKMNLKLKLYDIELLVFGIVLQVVGWYRVQVIFAFLRSHIYV